MNLNIQEFKTLCETRLTPNEFQSLAIALDSIAKRVDYCDVFYKGFKDIGSGWITMESVAQKVDPDPRIQYEAYTYAFLQNLHALLDYLPYVLNIVIRKYADIEHAGVRWDKKFIKNYQSESFSDQLTDLFQNEMHCMLLYFVNRSKHKHLVRIRNDFGRLTFEDFPYKHMGNKKTAESLNVEKFMIDTHDKLLPDFIKLCNAIKAEL